MRAYSALFTNSSVTAIGISWPITGDWFPLRPMEIQIAGSRKNGRTPLFLPNPPANLHPHGVMLDYIFMLHTKFRSRIHRCVRLPRGTILKQESRKTGAYSPSYIDLKSGGEEVSEELGDRGITGSGASSSGAIELKFGMHFAL